MRISQNQKRQKHFETFFVNTKQLIDKKEQKNGQKVPSLEVVEVVLVHCNLVDNQY